VRREFGVSIPVRRPSGTAIMAEIDASYIRRSEAELVP